MKIGDIVKHRSGDTLGVIVEIDHRERRGHANGRLYPYRVYFCDGDYDWFKVSAIEKINE